MEQQWKGGILFAKVHPIVTKVPLLVTEVPLLVTKVPPCAESPPSQSSSACMSSSAPQEIAPVMPLPLPHMFLSCPLHPSSSPVLLLTFPTSLLHRLPASSGIATCKELVPTLLCPQPCSLLSSPLRTPLTLHFLAPNCRWRTCNVQEVVPTMLCSHTFLTSLSHPLNAGGGPATCKSWCPLWTGLEWTC